MLTHKQYVQSSFKAILDITLTNWGTFTDISRNGPTVYNMGSLGNVGHRDLLAKKGENEYLGPETEPSQRPVLVNPAGFISIIPSEQTLPGLQSAQYSTICAIMSIDNNYPVCNLCYPKWQCRTIMPDNDKIPINSYLTHISSSYSNVTD